MITLTDFYGPNAGYVLELYDRYRRDPGAVDAATRAFFEQAGELPLELPETTPSAAPTAIAGAGASLDQLVGVTNLAKAIREYGHLAAQLDPLGAPPPGDPALDPQTYSLSEDDLRRLPAAPVGGPIAAQASSAWDALEQLHTIYSSTTGFDFDHINAPTERAWLREAVESRRFRPAFGPREALNLLARLTQVEGFEQFLHRAFPGKTRFSLEGLDMLVPMLDEIICGAAGAQIHNILIGMAHRGRLNVLAHILNKPYQQIFAEFQDPARRRDRTFAEDLGWTGDVRYHAGGLFELDGALPVDMVISLAPNPSHLEHVDPVVMGMARAAGTEVSERGPGVFDPTVSLPILIHGDASFPGQGVVAETLNLSCLPGYHTGGTLHIIANNQLGYTTRPSDARSTLYASDLAKGFEMPIVHVNADDPEAVVEAARLAYEYRFRFQKDFMLDLIGYRRYGHNEGDEPSFTQPLLYRAIEQHPSVRELWARQLVERGVMTADEVAQQAEQTRQRFQQLAAEVKPERDLSETPAPLPPAGAADHVVTAVPLARLRELNQALLTLPDEFNLNPKSERPMRRRRAALDEPDQPALDWATAEHLALASILQDGTPIRLTGEDVQRGTFGQRHAVLHDVQTGQTYAPLQSIPQARAAFEIYDSPLSEVATLGFEYGYNVQKPERLVLWEAQYGDFINVGQAMTDEFLTSARNKWGQTPSLVLLLPHGFEGQGPDH